MNAKRTSRNKASRGRPKTFDREQTIDVAMQAYWCEGVNDISLNEVCRRAEISKPGLYREFGNEDGLMKAVLTAYQKQVLAPVYQMVAVDAPFQETLAKLVSVVTTVSDDPEAPKGCLLVKMRESYLRVGETTREQIDEAREQAVTAYQDWVERAKANGEFTVEMSSRFAAVYIDAQLSHALSQIARGEPSDEVRKILTVALSMLG